MTTTTKQDCYPRQSRDRGWPTTRPVGHERRSERIGMIVGVLAAVFVIVLLVVEKGGPL